MAFWSQIFLHTVAPLSPLAPTPPTFPVKYDYSLKLTGEAEGRGQALLQAQMRGGWALGRQNAAPCVQGCSDAARSPACLARLPQGPRAQRAAPPASPPAPPPQRSPAVPASSRGPSPRAWTTSWCGRRRATKCTRRRRSSEPLLLLGLWVCALHLVRRHRVSLYVRGGGGGEPRGACAKGRPHGAAAAHPASHVQGATLTGSAPLPLPRTPRCRDTKEAIGWNLLGAASERAGCLAGACGTPRGVFPTRPCAVPRAACLPPRPRAAPRAPRPAGTKASTWEVTTPFPLAFAVIRFDDFFTASCKKVEALQRTGGWPGGGRPRLGLGPHAVQKRNLERGAGAALHP